MKKGKEVVNKTASSSSKMHTVRYPKGANQSVQLRTNFNPQRGKKPKAR